jgi:hypothetical protein
MTLDYKIGEFVEIVGFKNYRINKQGIVISFAHKHEKILTPYLNTNGYYYVTLGKTKKGMCIKKNVHRLLAETFLSNPENKLCINHINSNKTDNRLENLEWATHSENINHGVLYGNIGFGEEHHACSKLSNQDVIDIRNFLNAGGSGKEVSEKYKISSSYVTLLRQNKRRRYG